MNTLQIIIKSSNYGLSAVYNTIKIYLYKSRIQNLVNDEVQKCLTFKRRKKL